MINNTTLVGRLTKNLELKYTGSGIAVASFILAVERNYKNAQGERETDFINCVAWRGTAETISNFAVKGSLLGITGAIQTRNYDNNQGQTVYVTEVVVDNFQMLEPKDVTDSRRSQQGQSSNQSNYQNTQKNNSPFQSGNFSNHDPFENNSNLADINDDDLPFDFAPMR